MKKFLMTATVIGLLAGSGIAPATADPVAPHDASAYDPSVRAPGPGDLTWAQVQEMERTTNMTGEFTSKSPLAANYATVPMNNGTVKCTIDTQKIYKRTSGWKYPHGTVGAHPRTVCTTPMISIQQSVEVYKTVWWGLQKVGGPFTSGNMGVRSLEQKNVEVICADLRLTTFRMFVRGTGRFPHGTTGTASAWQQTDRPEKCGTN